MTNKLKEEKSPYLKQHKDNPVNWFAWNKESLEQAKIGKKRMGESGASKKIVDAIILHLLS